MSGNRKNLGIENGQNRHVTKQFVEQLHNELRPLKRPLVIIDGSNVAHQGQRDPKIEFLSAVINEVRTISSRMLVVVDANLRHKIDDKAKLEEMLHEGVLYQSHPRVSADRIIIEMAAKENQKGNDVLVISNDLGIEKNLQNHGCRVSIFSATIESEIEVLLIPTHHVQLVKVECDPLEG